MKRWAWGLGVVLALGVVLGLAWPDTSSPAREASSGSESTRAGMTRKASGEGGAPVAPGAPSRGGGSLRGVVLSLIGQPMPGVSIVALAVPAEGTPFWGDDSCRGEGVMAGRLVRDCEPSVPPIEETLEAVQVREVVLLRATSDAEGTFELTGLAEGLYEVWAEAPHGVAVRRVMTGTEGTRFVLEEGTRFAGFTRDERDEAIPGASVVLLARDLVRHFEAVSGADGHFSFGRVPTGRYRVLGARDGLLPDMDELAPHARREVTLTLQAPHVITGQVMRRGQGVPGAQVRASGLRYEQSVVTDGQGRFTFDGVRAGGYTVTSFIGREGALAMLQVKDAEPSRVVLELQPCAVLEGGVSAGSGASLPEAEVTFQLFADRVFKGSARTDARGHYRFDCLPPGLFEATARAKGFRSRSFEPGEWRLVPGEPLRVDFRLSEAAPFDGIVVDTEGQPVPGARVLMYQAEDEQSPSEGESIDTVDVLTGEDGRFSADGLAPGLYGVQISPPSEAFLAGHEEARVPNTAVRFVLERAPPTPGVIAGTVVDERGQPLPGVLIDAQTQPPGQDEPRTLTDDLGQFRLERLRLASWRIIASHEGFERSGQVRATAQVEVPGPEPVLVKLQLAEGLPVSGRVVDAQGAPVPFTFVTATRERSGSQETLRGGSVETDAQGRFTLAHLLPGDHELEASPDGLEGLLAPSRATVRAGDTDVRIVLGPMPQVRGRVVHADGSPVPEAFVNGKAFSDKEGRFSLPLSMPGAHFFVFTAEGLAPTLRRFEAKPDADAVLPDVRMVRGEAVRGRVLDAVTGKPLQEAWVAPLGFAPEDDLVVDTDLGWVWTQPDGRFQVPSVEPGAVLTVDCQGYQPARVPAPRGGEEVVIRLYPL